MAKLFEQALYLKRYIEANDDIKRCPTSLVFREMQNKITTRYHFTPIDTAKIKKYWQHTVLARMWSSWNPHESLVGMQNDIATLQSNLAVPTKVKHVLTIWPSNPTLFGTAIYPREIRTCVYTKLYVYVYCAKYWKQFKCASTVE